MAESTKTYAGGCHCGAVRYEARLDLGKGISRCNCSICHKQGRSGVIVKPDEFTLLKGEEALTTYRWGHMTGTYLFCKHCGVHSFSRGHLDVLGGDYVSVNTQCIDDLDLAGIPVSHWDGRHDNWQAGPRSEPWPMRT